MRQHRTTSIRIKLKLVGMAKEIHGLSPGQLSGFISYYTFSNPSTTNYTAFFSFPCTCQTHFENSETSLCLKCSHQEFIWPSFSSFRSQLKYRLPRKDHFTHLSQTSSLLTQHDRPLLFCTFLIVVINNWNINIT